VYDCLDRTTLLVRCRLEVLCCVDWSVLVGGMGFYLSRKMDRKTYNPLLILLFLYLIMPLALYLVK
jgi:hypothetical protein